MRATFRLLGMGSVIAYRALFNWTTPIVFVGSLLVGPLFQLIFFAYVGRELSVGDDRFYIVGNAVLAAAWTCVFGGTMAIGNERRFGTLGHVLLSPRSRTLIFLGRATPYALNGLLVAAVILAVGATVLGLHIPASAIPLLALCLAAGAVASAFFGLTLGALGLRFRDIWVISNVTSALMVLLTGVNVPLDQLPAGLRAIGSVLPITHAAAAARDAAAGAGLAAIAPDLLTEAGIALAYAVLTAVLLRVFEAESRRRASLDTL
ncbi:MULTISPECIES: ABC transporter permease [Catenuloplanes]|uniref:Transport permease protein n=1 Tax=Catenuloplanes niger TaxID=587534 RepID=A0AAE3ZLD6_9ACTN|nr:ABC transporter permease [Catenuloplanes niger]MDR7322053.1 ABC-2 type transport system permease protein [Catenuloplanes niger]